MVCPMTESSPASIPAVVDAVYRSDSRRVFATLVRLLGDFDVAEEALHDAFRAALEQWPREGVPVNPRAWLVSTGRFKAIDAIRRRARFVTLPTEWIEGVEAGEEHGAGEAALSPADLEHLAVFDADPKASG